MGNNTIDKYNKKGDVDIEISLKKVCFYPGETIDGNIKLIPHYVFNQEIKEHSELIIKIIQYSHYKYTDGSDWETDDETIELINEKFGLGDFFAIQNEKEINIQINYILPTYARPSIFCNRLDYVKHYITVEYPYFDVRRTLLFIVKNHLKYHFTNIKFENPFNVKSTFNKKKFFKKKGSCQLIINMPKNYFLYNEKVGYNIVLDCRTLNIPVKKLKVSLIRRVKKNNSHNLLHTRERSHTSLIDKEYNLDKKQKLFNFVDYFLLTESFKQNVDCKSPSDIYKQMDLHGLYEINDQSLINFYPCCAVGLLNIKYSIKVKVYYDSVFTSDDIVIAPFIFCDILDDYLENINLFNNEYEASNICYLNNSQLNIINNNNNIKNNNIINNESLIPSTVQNIDTSKNYLEDKDEADLKDWVIIDK